LRQAGGSRVEADATAREKGATYPVRRTRRGLHPEVFAQVGLADALILASMWAQKRDGMDRAGTGVGSANHTGALAIYDYLGFRTVGQTRLYAIEI